MACRKITTEVKVRPSEAEILAQMKIKKDKYVSMGIQNHQVWNMDETAVTWCIGSTICLFLNPRVPERSTKGYPT